MGGLFTRNTARKLKTIEKYSLARCLSEVIVTVEINVFRNLAELESITEFTKDGL